MSARARRRAVWPFVVVAVVVALLGGLVLADRVLQAQAEQSVAERLRTELGLAAAPRVDIEGFPFVTQLVRRSFPSVRVGADGLDPPGDAVGAERVDLALRDVKTDAGFGAVTAGTVDGTARLSWEETSQLVGQPLRPDRDGRVRLDTTASVAGFSTDVTVTGLPVVDVAAQTVTLGEPALTVNGRELPQAVADSLASTVAQPIPLTGVPLDLQVTGLQAEEAGVTATLHGEGVALSR